MYLERDNIKDIEFQKEVEKRLRLIKNEEVKSHIINMIGFLKNKYGSIRIREKRQIRLEVVKDLEFQKTYIESFKHAFDCDTIFNPNVFTFGDNVVYAISCCWQKSNLESGTMEQIYINTYNQKFYKYMKSKNINYATISDHLGIIWRDEIFNSYNLGPASLIFEENLMYNGEKIAIKCFEKGIDTVCFFQPAPSRAEVFLRQLSYASDYYLQNYGKKLKLMYAHKFSDINKIKVKKLI